MVTNAFAKQRVSESELMIKASCVVCARGPMSADANASNVPRAVKTVTTTLKT